MHAILVYVYRYVNDVKDYLETYGTKYLVYIDNYNKFLGCGVNERVALQIDPKYFPSQNRLGLMRKDIFQKADYTDLGDE